MNFFNYFKKQEFFDGTLGTWKTDLVDFELKKDATVICSRPFTVPKVNREMIKKEV